MDSDTLANEELQRIIAEVRIGYGFRGKSRKGRKVASGVYGSRKDPWPDFGKGVPSLVVYDKGDCKAAYPHIEMAWCASEQLGWFGECRFRFFYGVMPRCGLCPLFPVERAVRDVLGENTPNTIEIRLPARLEALLAGEPLPPMVAPPLDPNWWIPDHPPDHWWQDLGEAPPSD